MNFVVKNGSKMRESVAAFIPQPVSVTSANTKSPSATSLPTQASAVYTRVTCIRSVFTMIRPGDAPIASDALVMRFMITCRIWAGSPSNGGRSDLRSSWISALLATAVRSRFAISPTTSERLVDCRTNRPRPE